MAKVRVLVRGNVQGAGYRALLVHTARRFRIKGLTRNLKDGNVEIFCEGTKKDINSFLRTIEVKGDPEAPFNLHVEDVQCFWEGQEEYREAWRPYENFEIDYGVRMSEYQYLAMEDREYGKLYLSNLMRTEKETREGVQNLTHAQKETRGEIHNLTLAQKETTNEIRNLTYAQKETREEIHNLTQAQKETTKEIHNLTKAEKETKNEIHNRFDETKNSYDKISKQIAVLESVPKELQLLRKSIDRYLDAMLQGQKTRTHPFVPASKTVTDLEE